MNLSKGSIGEDNSNLLGSFLITKLQLAAMSRVDMPEAARNDFYLYVDEFQNFTTDSFATILSEARKYRLNLVLAHQYIAQLTESGNDKVRNAIFGNVSTMISFRVGSDDGEVLEKEYEPIFVSPQLLALNKFQIALKLSIHGKPSLPFMSNTLPPIFNDYGGSYDKVVQQSRERNAVIKSKAKKKIDDWTKEHYHKPSDEVKDWWDLSGTVEDLELFFEMGRHLATSDDWPEWSETSEFRAVREASRDEP
ncbi:MAG: TraM recognition domain-containing protein [Thermales bacterium]|nr:TraM recognition domain-containing protein [Thermales bacterium]